jgi:hypothetical protein
MERNIFNFVFSPNSFYGIALPKGFGKRRAIVGSIDFGADDPNRSGGINTADALGCRIAGHPTSYNQIFIMLHRVTV